MEQMMHRLTETERWVIREIAIYLIGRQSMGIVACYAIKAVLESKK
ncbi:hypothetical protein LCGC14_0427670 [marine sediment metagenome]|uniref:Uncharacterized protein n=1 Tax=marine sediment metagenome TaxID=412755 RepID=A0A0F9T774_9ZZZZ